LRGLRSAALGGRAARPARRAARCARRPRPLDAGAHRRPRRAARARAERRLDGSEERRSLEAALRARFGDPPPRAGERRPRWIEAVIRPSLWLDQERIASAGLDPAAVARFAADTLAGLPGIELAATRSQLAAVLATGAADTAVDP